MTKKDLTKYERARLIGARALQLARGAPPLVEVEEGMINSLVLARREFDKKVIPLQVLSD